MLFIKNIYQGRQITIEIFDSVTLIPIITNLIVETEETFDSKDFPVIDVFHVVDPRNIFTIVP